MKVRDLLARAGPDAEIMVIYDEKEDELAIHPTGENTVRVEMDQGKRKVVIDLRCYVKDIYVDSDK